MVMSHRTSYHSAGAHDHEHDPSRARSTVGRVLVVGAGVSGLTSALCLARLGVEVEIVAEKFGSDLVSVVAGALWEWPPAVCGYHRNQQSLERSKAWAQESYEIFCDLARDPSTGVFMRRANFYFTSEQTARELHKMNELAPKVRGFVHESGLAEANGIDPAYGVIDAYAHLAPMIDTDRYMVWLRRQVEAVGVTITQRRIEGRLADQEAALLVEFRADAIVNATGLGAAVTDGRPTYPLRGALVRAINDSSRIPKVDQAHCVPKREGSTTQDMVFIVPRGENMLLMGGLTEEDEWSLDIGLHNYQPVRDMYRRCLAFMPALERADLDPDEPVRVGPRPMRNGNVCLEQEVGTRIVHNYAHGGSGFSLSWGCGSEVAAIVTRQLRGAMASAACGPAVAACSSV
jgi:D-amino-acid oxidase